MDWTTTGLQDHYGHGLTGPFSIFAGFNYHLFIYIKHKNHLVWRKLLGHAQKSLVMDRRIKICLISVHMW